jgi:hypothetical protein
MTITPNTTLYNAGVLYVNGLGITWASNTTLTIAIGAARDVTNTNDIINPTALTLNAATNGANALDTGTFAASTMYYIWIVGSSTLQANTCCLLSLSSTAPTLPVGYDMQRRIGAAFSNSSTHFALAWWQSAESQGAGTNSTSRWCIYDAPIATGITAGAATTYTAVNLEKTVPLTASIVRVEVALTAGTAFDSVFLQPYGGTGAATVFSSPVTATALLGVVDCPVGVNATPLPDLKYKVSSAGDAVALNVQGYLDEL